MCYRDFVAKLEKNLQRPDRDMSRSVEHAEDSDVFLSCTHPLYAARTPVMPPQ
jgi:hypothetical protein